MLSKKKVTALIMALVMLSSVFTMGAAFTDYDTYNVASDYETTDYDIVIDCESAPYEKDPPLVEDITDEYYDEYDYSNYVYGETEENGECDCDYGYECYCNEYYIDIMPLSTFNVSNWSQLHNVFTNLMTVNGNYIVVLENDIPMAEQLTITGGRQVTITTAGTTRTLTAAVNATTAQRHFIVTGAGSSLTLQNVVLDGAGTATSTVSRGGVVVQQSAGLRLESGSVIRGAFWNTSGTGSGVHVASGGSITLVGGTVSENVIYGVSTSAGGIRLTGSSSTFEMINGTVSGNRSIHPPGIFSTNAAGVKIQAGAHFNMVEGDIVGNVAEGSASAGGVFVVNSTFTMTGGLIRENYLPATGFFDSGGGGVHVATGGIFAMSGGQIRSNVNARQGGAAGVMVSGTGIFNFTVGTVGGLTENDGNQMLAAFGSGGVRLSNNAQLNMSGSASILNNTAALGSSAGGLNLGVNATANLQGNAQIRSNTAAGSSGGGISATSNTTVSISGDVRVNDNLSTGSGGGGLLLTGTATVNIQGSAQINDNTSTGNNGSGGITMTTNSTLNLAGNATVNDNISTGTAGAGGLRLAGSATVNMQESAQISNNIASDTDANSAGGVNLINANSSFVMTGGIIDNNTAAIGGVRIGNGSFVMSGGSVTNNDAMMSGGGFWVGNTGNAASPALTITNGTVSNNTAAENGGGIFTAQHRNVATLDVTDYANIMISSAVTFSGNSAVRSSIPPTNPEVLTHIQTTPRTTSMGANSWLLNNYDINYMHPTHPVTFDLGGGNVDGDTANITKLLFDTHPIGLVNIPTPILSGHHLVGWLDGAGNILTNAELAQHIVSEAVTFTAQWEITNIIIPSEYRRIRIYYAIEGDGLITTGREYSHEIGTRFYTTSAFDRTTLVGANVYIFDRWAVHVDGEYTATYLADMNRSLLHTSFMVNQPPADTEGLITLVAIWSIYDGEEPTITTPQPTPPPATGGGNQQGILPATGIESNIVLWSVLLSLVTFITTGIVVWLINNKAKVSTRKQT